MNRCRAAASRILIQHYAARLLHPYIALPRPLGSSASSAAKVCGMA